MMDIGLGYFLVHLLAKWRAYLGGMESTSVVWLMIGLVGQLLFTMRFIVQWIHSERHQKSVIPKSFWYLSLTGGLIVLAYGVHRTDPVIILGQLPGTFIYARNLALMRREDHDLLTEINEAEVG